MTEVSDGDLAVDFLCNLLDRTELVALVREALGNEIDSIESSFGVSALNVNQAAKCLISLNGRNFLANRNIRSAIAKAAHADDLRAAYREAVKTAATLLSADETDRAAQISVVASRAWHPGSAWARTFCTAFQLPIRFSGQSDDVSIAPIERVNPFVPLGVLHAFQVDIGTQIRRALEQSRTARALIALPTGSGKTRLMVETMLELPAVESGDRKLVWVAQHNELCEQAVRCFTQVWSSKARPRNRELAIQRVWRGMTDELDWSADVFVGTPQSLSNRLANASRDEREAVITTVIDEAHHTLGDSYATLFALLSHASIFGITATPGSSTVSAAKTLRLRFANKIMLAQELGERPVSRLTELGFLATPEVEDPIKTNVRMKFDEQASGTAFGDLPSSALNSLGANGARNRLIISRLLMMNFTARVLCFAPSVRSARAIAGALAINGRSARSIDAESDIRYRNETVDEFNAGRIQFLINYGVLATGFDAPKIDCLVMARPTTSPVLYEQMLGRGLRGPKNGGTETCKIIHFEDDFEAFGGIAPMSYGRFLDLTSK